MNIRILAWIKKTGATVLPMLLTVTLISCPTSLSKSMTNEVLDSVAPIITVLTPDDGDSYGAYTLITGNVGDKADNSSEGKVVSLFVEILGVTGNQGVTISDDGSFSVTLPTNGAGYNSDIVVKLTATDWNGNSSETTMALRKADGEITGFTVTAGNRSAEITWNTLPEASSYTIWEYPSHNSKSDITGTSYKWEDLTNGNNYSFSVSAEIDGKTFLSSIIDIIPLSPLTLAPGIESVYRGIYLTWKEIPAASNYIVEKARERDGQYSFVAETEEPNYLDKNLKRDARYYYRVYPVWGGQQYNPDVMRSVPNFGSAGYFHGRNDYSIFSSVDTSNSSFTVKVQGDYAYIADGTDGLWIADISDIYNPVIASYCDNTSIDLVAREEDPPDYDSNGNTRGVALSDDGDYAYIANNNTGMEIINISDPDSPFLMPLDNDILPFDYDTDEAIGIDIFDQTINSILNYYVCIADGPDGIKVINVTHSSNLGSADSESTSYARKITVDENYIYLANSPDIPDSTSGVKIYAIDTDQNDPLNLSISYIGICQDTDTDTDKNDSQEVAVSGNYVYVAEKGNGFNVYTINDKTDESSFDFTGPSTFSFTGNGGGDALGVAVSGDRAYVARSPNSSGGIPGLSIIDITTPSTPVLIGTCATPGKAQSVTINGDYAFVADYNSGLQIIDISEPDASFIRSVDTGTVIDCGIKISGNYAFVTDGDPLDEDYTSGAFKVFSLADPENPVLVGSNSADVENCTGIAVSGNYAYVTDYNPGLHIFDISNPSNPVLKATADIKASTPGRSINVTISGSYAYIAAKDNGLQIVDISDPLHPELAGLCDMAHEAASVAISGSYAYVVGYDYNGGSFLIVMNISDPDHPYQVGSYTGTGGTAYGIAVSGNYAYMAEGSNGLQVLDISDPANPTAPSTGNLGYLATNSAYSVTISGSYVFVADGFDGLRVVDISDPANPVEVTSADTTGAATAVAVAGHYAYVADYDGGLAVINLGE